jgi:hypothetical protein
MAGGAKAPSIALDRIADLSVFAPRCRTTDKRPMPDFGLKHGRT